jgi:hypothetical protein
MPPDAVIACGRGLAANNVNMEVPSLNAAAQAAPSSGC